MSETQTVVDYNNMIIAEVIDKLAINDDLELESKRQIKLFGFIQTHYVKATRRLEELTNLVDQVKHYRTRYYSGKLNADTYAKEPLRESPLKGDIPDLLKVDPKVIEAKFKLNEQERLVKFLEDSKKQLSERSFLINTALSFQKLSLGIV